MKTRLFLANILLLSFLGACNGANSDKFTLSGHIDNTEDFEAVLLYEGETFLDSLVLDEKGSFYMEGTAEGPTAYQLVIGPASYMLILENGDKVEFSTDLHHAQDYSVKGSKASAKMKELNQMMETFQDQQMGLQSEYEERIGSGEDQSIVQNELIQKDAVFSREISEQLLKFTKENEDNLSGFFGMLMLFSVNESEHEQTLVAYAEKAKDQFPNNETVQAFAEYMESIKSLSIGQVAPDFGALTPDGKEVKLSDLRGQYVLLDFWAAWCTPCRHENPNIVEQYHAFKDKGFTVFGVSLDRERDAWLQAIEDDKLEWTQVSELKMWDSEAGRLYNITSIPASFMIDPDGKIVGKNLRGPALKEFLEKTL